MTKDVKSWAADFRDSEHTIDVCYMYEDGYYVLSTVFEQKATRDIYAPAARVG